MEFLQGALITLSPASEISRGDPDFCPPGRDPDAAFDFLAVYERRFRRAGAYLATLAGSSRPAVNPLLAARGSLRRRYRSRRNLVQAVDLRFAIPSRTHLSAAP